MHRLGPMARRCLQPVAHLSGAGPWRQQGSGEVAAHEGPQQFSCGERQGYIRGPEKDVKLHTFGVQVELMPMPGACGRKSLRRDKAEMDYMQVRKQATESNEEEHPIFEVSASRN